MATASLLSSSPIAIPKYTPTQTSPVASQALGSQTNPLTNSFGGVQSSTPQAGGLGLSGINPFNEASFGQKVTPTSSGGISFDPSFASNLNKSQSTLAKAQTGTISNTGLEQYTNKSYQTPNGGTLTTSNSGDVTGYTPSNGFTIDTSGHIDSSALGSNIGTNDVQQNHSAYMDKVLGLAQAQGYSPEYIQALQSLQKAQTEGAQYNLNNAALNSNFYTGNNLPGDTLNYAQGATAKAQAQNTLGQAQNSIQQLSANQQMEVQTLLRSGNIAAAQSLVQAYAPVGVSPGTSLVSPVTGQEQYSGLGGLTGVNAANQYNHLQQTFPDANIPAYDSSLTPQENQQLAMKAVQSAPSFQSQTPEGQANISSLVSQQGYLDTTTRAYQTATSNLGTLQTFMQQNGINDNSVPIINQINNKVKGGLLDPGVVASFKSSLEGLRNEYAQVLSRGGSVTDTERKSANTLIPDNLSPSQLQTVTKQLSKEGQNAVTEAQNQVNTIKSRLTGNSNSTSNSSGWY